MKSPFIRSRLDTLIWDSRLSPNSIPVVNTRSQAIRAMLTSLEGVFLLIVCLALAMFGSTYLLQPISLLFWFGFIITASVLVAWTLRINYWLTKGSPEQVRIKTITSSKGNFWIKAETLAGHPLHPSFYAGSWASDLRPGTQITALTSSSNQLLFISSMAIKFKTINTPPA